ncbi:MAG: hypothetical protein HYX90_01105 [Chloroflexi bacterium]|nr:hypothetical protein [Chloroflexota bacterium]
MALGIVRKATFKSKHNLTKSYLLVILWHLYQADQPGRTAFELATLLKPLGYGVAGIRTCLNHYVTAKSPYVIRKPSTDHHRRLCWRYSISEKGCRFCLARMPSYIFQARVADLKRVGVLK